MRHLNFYSQRLPPFLVGYFYEGRVGEREIVATIVHLAVNEKVILREISGEYMLWKEEGSKSEHEYENELISCIPEKPGRLKKVMEEIRKNDRIERLFRVFLEQEYDAKVDAENGLLIPNLSKAEREALDELVEYLNSTPPANPENLSREFLPYYIAAGKEGFWLKQFGAEEASAELPIPFIFWMTGERSCFGKF